MCGRRGSTRVPRSARLTAGAVLACIALAGCANARYWATHYIRLGIPLCAADYAGFSQRVSLIPPLVMPLMMLLHALLYSGARRARVLYRYPSRRSFWRMLCRSALAESLLAGTTLVASSLLPALAKGGPALFLNWKSPFSLFALQAGSPLQREIPPLQLLAGYWAAACLQLCTCLLLFAVLETRLRTFPAFVSLLLADLALNSANRRSLWDTAGLTSSVWARPGGVFALLLGWLAVLAALFFAGDSLYRKADVL